MKNELLLDAISERIKEEGFESILIGSYAKGYVSFFKIVENISIRVLLNTETPLSMGSIRKTIQTYETAIRNGDKGYFDVGDIDMVSDLLALLKSVLRSLKIEQSI